MWGLCIMAVRPRHTAGEFFSAGGTKRTAMGRYDQHRRRLSVWFRLLIAVAASGVLFAPYLIGTYEQYPAAFWSATVIVMFFAVWACAGLVWHYSILYG